MKNIYNHSVASRNSWCLRNLGKTMMMLSIILLSLPTQVNSQAPYTRPSWFFGVAGAANFNFYNGTTQQLNSTLTVPAAFHKGTGIGLYVAPLIEFHKPQSFWGFMLQGGIDSRMGEFATVTNPCNCPADLKTDVSYISIEPSVRMAPGKGNFYIYLGPRLAMNTMHSFTYKVGANPEYPNQPLWPDIKGDFSDMNKYIISGQVGAGYDIYLSSTNHKTQFVLSPFVAYHPYFGQDPRTVNSWNINTVRAGIALKLGAGHSTEKKVVKETPPEKVIVVAPKEVEAKFAVTAPKNIPVVHRTRETFPIRNYIFFDLGSSEIPNRYILLNKNQVSDFKEDQLEVMSPKNLNGRSARQLTVYYNILNILGDRMQKNPNTKITLVGSSEKGPDDGREMAQSVKNYLVNVWGIDASRIAIVGQTKPNLPSEQPGGDKELDLLREGDRRVSIESNSPALLMEFQSGPEAPLKPIEIIETQESIDSSIVFNLEGANEIFKSWKLEIKDDKGQVQTYGPYTVDKITIPVRTILGTRAEGDYLITMVGTTKDDKIVKKATTSHLVNYTPPRIEEGMRYSVLFEFNESRAINIYDKYLTDVVTPKIPMGGTVVIHGHTDIIGQDDYNQKLSMARAAYVRTTIENALKAAGRTDVKFQVIGYGEDTNQAPFENKLPEERFYNRTVIVDIIPMTN